MAVVDDEWNMLSHCYRTNRVTVHHTYFPRVIKLTVDRSQSVKPRTVEKVVDPRQLPTAVILRVESLKLQQQTHHAHMADGTETFHWLNWVRGLSLVIFDIWALWRLTLIAEHHSARMSKITNDGLTQSRTRCFIAVPIWQQWASKG